MDHTTILFNNINCTRFLYIPDNYVEDHLLLNIRHPQYFQLHGSSPIFVLCIHACLDKFPQHQNGTVGPLNGMAYSPDLTPHDCWTQGMLKEHVYSSKPRDAQENQKRNELVNTTNNKSQRYGGNLKMVPGMCYGNVSDYPTQSWATTVYFVILCNGTSLDNLLKLAINHEL